ncbi:MAG: glycosyl transferase [Tannerellaceae bacterium]|jgi:glycosyltransferase involved in cell wall biosynthesis|nr:glycosyl transferase [Tannerellaceae bacterium]
MENTVSVVYILIGVTVGLFLVQSAYWLLLYARPLRKLYQAPLSQKKKTATPPVSIVLYVERDVETLQEQLLSLLSQDYPSYEVVVVIDDTSGQSEVILKGLEEKHSNLYHTYIPEGAKYVSRKKLALTIGIKAAKHDILLFTEVRCHPVSNKWIASLSQAYTPETEIVQGLCGYRYTDGFMHRFIAYDNLIEGMQYLSATLAHHPFTGNGRNLSYRKSLFFNKKGYYQSLALRDGDDDLFVNESATPKNTRIVYSADSLTETPPVAEFRQWMATKFARAVTSSHYKGAMPLFFRMETLSYFLFLGAGIITVLMGLPDMWKTSAVAGGLVLTRYVIKVVILHKASALFRQKPVTMWLFVLEFIHPLFGMYIHIRRFFHRKEEYTLRVN